jgi:serine/threonine-protein kinase
MKCPSCQAETPAASRTCSRCSAPLPSTGTDLEGRTLRFPDSSSRFGRGTTFAARYEIIEELGRGGMGTILRVFDRETEEEIAIKILNSDVAADVRTIERFRNELKLARRISHKMSAGCMTSTKRKAITTSPWSTCPAKA